MCGGLQASLAIEIICGRFSTAAKVPILPGRNSETKILR
jgi:hypothetical protein